MGQAVQVFLDLLLLVTPELCRRSSTLRAAAWFGSFQLAYDPHWRHIDVDVGAGSVSLAREFKPFPRKLGELIFKTCECNLVCVSVRRTGGDLLLA
jgi:hypothetical protein